MIVPLFMSYPRPSSVAAPPVAMTGITPFGQQSFCQTEAFAPSMSTVSPTGGELFFFTFMQNGTGPATLTPQASASTWTKIQDHTQNNLNMQTWATIWQSGDSLLPKWDVTPEPISPCGSGTIHVLLSTYTATHGVTNLATDIVVTVGQGTSTTPAWPGGTITADGGQIYRPGVSYLTPPPTGLPPSGHTYLTGGSPAVFSNVIEFQTVLIDQTAGAKGSASASFSIPRDWIFPTFAIPP